METQELWDSVAVGNADPAWGPHPDSRLERLLQIAKIYVYTVSYESGCVVTTRHSSGCQTVTGYAQEDYERDPALWISMVHRDDKEEVCRKVIAAEHSSKATRIEHRIIHRDGTLRWVRNTIIPYFCKGNLVCCDGLIEDVTERKSAERSLTHHTMQLTAAQEIQRRLLPQLAPRIPGTEIAGGLIPAEYAAGDFYDYLTLPDGAPAFVIGDVSGHGFGPALLMSLTHTLVRILGAIENDVEVIFAQINAFLFKETQEDRFVTLFLARYDIETRSITYVSAGHPPAYVINREGELRARLTSTAFPLGVVENATFPSAGNFHLECNDVLLMLTDGILETSSPEHQMFGEKQTIEVLRRHRSLPAHRILDALQRQLRTFSKGAELIDDITAVILKIN